MASQTPESSQHTDVAVSSDASAQHLRDFKLAIEYKHLMKHAPGGVYMMPHIDNIREFFGVIFVRRGLYRNGIFRFRISLAREYNSANCPPLVTFTPPIFNPLVDNETGMLDLSCEESFREWNPERNFLVSVLFFLKKIFYMKSFSKYTVVPNPEARDLFANSKEEYYNRVQECVRQSLNTIHENPPNCTIIFTEPKPAHENLKKAIFEGKGKQTKEVYDVSNEAEDDADKEVPQTPGEV